MGGLCADGASVVPDSQTIETVAGSAVCSAAEETTVVSELVPVGKLSTLDGAGLGTGDGIECIWGCKERSKVVAKFLYVDERYRQVAIFERC